jgi:S-(hydroxymethyl)glutathione synthase
MTRLLHPSVQNGLTPGSNAFAGGVLTCKCLDRPVKVKVSGGTYATSRR